MNKKNNNNNKGFTLVELIIAMSILSIVLTIGYNIINKSSSVINLQQYITQNQSVANLVNTYISKDIEESKSVSEKEQINDNIYIYTITKGNNSLEYKIELGNKNGNKIYNLIRNDGDSSIEIISNQIRESNEPFLISLKNNKMYEIKILYSENNKFKEYSFNVTSRLSNDNGGNTSGGENGNGSGEGNTSGGENGNESGGGNTSGGENGNESGEGNTSGGENGNESGGGNTSDGENGDGSEGGNIDGYAGNADIIIDFQRNYEEPNNSNQFHMTNTMKVRDGENLYRIEDSATGNDFSDKMQIHFSNHVSNSYIQVMVQPKIGTKVISSLYGKDIAKTKKIILTLEGNIYLEQKGGLKEIIPNKQYEVYFGLGVNYGNHIITSGLLRGEKGSVKVNFVAD